MTYIAVEQNVNDLRLDDLMESVRNKFDRTTEDEWYIRKQLIERAIKMELPEDFILQLKKDNL
jgi:hypothetical protein